ncbi:MAG: trypsin-like peptidase domain-containing protein, partial [Elusimicrobiota bacterium]
RFQNRQEGMGSGVIVDPRGYFLTNEHVERNADDITVLVRDPELKEYKGKVVGKDPRSDLAVVKIQPKGGLSHAVLADSDKVRVGDWAIAVGSPFGLEQTVTVGVVSAVRQSLSIEGMAYSDLLQTDAAINRGNSGGPLINIRGEVIGINTAIYAPTGVFAGIGFAIPSARVRDIMEQLIEKGRVVRGWMGVEIAPLDDVAARQFGVPDGKGVLINRVLPGSPAEKAGLARGDVIRRFAGEKVEGPDALMLIVAKTAPKKKVEIVVLRQGKERELALVTGEMPSETAEGGEAAPEAPAARPDAKTWEGARLMNATPALTQRYGLSPQNAGVLVVGLQPGGVAEDMGLVEGDLILSVNRRDTPDVASFLAAMKRADLDDGVLLDVNRRNRLIYLSYKKG